MPRALPKSRSADGRSEGGKRRWASAQRTGDRGGLMLPHLPRKPETGRAEIGAAWFDRVAVFAQVDPAPARRAERRLERRRVFQLFEVVFVGAVPDVHLRFECRSAFFARLPLAAGVLLCVMVAAEGISLVVSEATFPREREHDVVRRIVANQVPATRRFCELAGLSAQAAAFRSCG
jgi:hypothetical protein